MKLTITVRSLQTFFLVAISALALVFSVEVLAAASPVLKPAPKTAPRPAFHTLTRIQLHSVHGEKRLAIVHDPKANTYFVERNSGKAKRKKIRAEIAHKIENDALNLVWTNEVDRKSTGKCTDSAGSLEVTASKESGNFCRTDIRLAAQLQEFSSRVEKLVN